jgi:hypothetical protein
MACTTRAGRVVNRNYFGVRLGVVLTAFALIKPASAERDPARWPQIDVPAQVDTFDVGEGMVVNGTPVRMRGFVSRMSPAVLAASFRQVLGKPLVESTRGNTLVLGREEGRYYITVQLEPLGTGARGSIAVTKPPLDEQITVDAGAARRLLSALPPGSTLASHISSVDAGARAEHDAIVNSHSIGINREYVQRMLRADGFTLERESNAAQAARARMHVESDARTLFFSRPGAEAIAVLFNDNRTGRSVLVLNRVNYTGSAK